VFLPTVGTRRLPPARGSLGLSGALAALSRLLLADHKPNLHPRRRFRSPSSPTLFCTVHARCVRPFLLPLLVDRAQLFQQPSFVFPKVSPPLHLLSFRPVLQPACRPRHLTPNPPPALPSIHPSIHPSTRSLSSPRAQSSDPASSRAPVSLAPRVIVRSRGGGGCDNTAAAPTLVC